MILVIFFFFALFRSDLEEILSVDRVYSLYSLLLLLLLLTPLVLFLFVFFEVTAFLDGMGVALALAWSI
jgi:hypothetical protein